MSYEYAMGMGQTRIPWYIQKKIQEKVQQDIAIKKAFSPDAGEKGISIEEKEEAGDRAAAEAVDEAAETAELESENGEEFIIDEESKITEEDQRFKMPIWGWAAIGGGGLILLTGIIAIARK